jgi:repressor LexA
VSNGAVSAHELAAAHRKPLTERQQQILDLIGAWVQELGFPPTRVEICEVMGFRSPNAAEDHLRAIAKKGHIELTAGKSRGITIL